MTPFLHGFGDELVKTSAARSLMGAGKFVMKHPLLSLGAGATVAGTAMAYRQGRKEGLRGGEKGRHIAATVDPISGRAHASRTARIPHGIFFKKTKSPNVSKNYDRAGEKAFKR